MTTNDVPPGGTTLSLFAKNLAGRHAGARHVDRRYGQFAEIIRTDCTSSVLLVPADAEADGVLEAPLVEPAAPEVAPAAPDVEPVAPDVAPAPEVVAPEVAPVEPDAPADGRLMAAALALAFPVTWTL